MKPYRIEDRVSREIIKECENFSEGWESLRELKNCELIRSSDSVLLAYKSKEIIDDTLPFIKLVSTGGPIGRS